MTMACLCYNCAPRTYILYTVVSGLLVCPLHTAITHVINVLELWRLTWIPIAVSTWNSPQFSSIIMWVIAVCNVGMGLEILKRLYIRTWSVFGPGWAPSIRLPMLWWSSDSFVITNTHSNYLLYINNNHLRAEQYKGEKERWLSVGVVA